MKAVPRLGCLSITLSAALASPVGAQTGANIVIPPRPQPQPPAAGSPVMTPAPAAVAPASPATKLPRRAEILVPLKERSFFLGEVPAVVDTAGGIDMPRDRIAVLLGPLISPTALAQLNALPDRISIDNLKSLGLEARFDAGLLEIVVVVPAEDKERRSIEIFDRDRVDRGQFVPPANFSAWLTWRSSFDYVHKGGEEGLDSPYVSFDSGIRFPGGWVLDNEATWDTDPDSELGFQRQMTRFSFDEVEKARRWEIGDLAPIARGFQASPDMAGFSLLKSYSTLQPSRNIRPRGQGAFSLREPGVVDVIVNGRVVRRLELDSGNYDVSDFPFAAGRNDVRFVVEDRTGRRDLISFNRFYDQTLLETGLAEYQLAVGVDAPFKDGAPTYDTDRWIVTGYYRRGVSDVLTLGGNMQADNDGAMVGGEGLWASPVGVVSFGAAVSNRSGATGWAVKGDYTLEVGSDDTARYSGGAYFEGRSERFAIVGDVGAVNNIALETGLFYTREINERTQFNADLGYLWGRGDEDNRGRASAGVSRRLSNATSISVDVEYDQGRSDDQQAFGAFFTLSHRFGATSYGRATHDTAEQRTRLAYQQSPSRPYDGWAIAADLDHTPDETAFNGSLYRTWNRIETTLSHLATYDPTGSEITQQRTSLRLGGSIAYAGGKASFGRPIYDGFAIVKGHKTLAGATVRIDPTKDGEIARSDMFGPALVTDLSAYSRRTITVGVDDLPAGYDLGKGSFDLLPPNRAGYVLTVGSAYSVTLIGGLLDLNDKPVTLAIAKAYDVADPKREPVILFTNRTGRFAAQGLKEGSWRIETGEGARKLVYEIQIGEGSTLVRLPAPLRPKGSTN